MLKGLLTEAATRGVPWKSSAILKILHYSHGKTYVQASSKPLQPFRPATLLKRDSNTGVFLLILRHFQEHLFRRTLENDCLRIKKNIHDAHHKSCWKSIHHESALQNCFGNYSTRKHSHKKQKETAAIPPNQADHSSGKSQYSHIFFFLFSCFSCGKCENTLVTCDV